MKKQFIAKLLVPAMVLSMVPVTILAASAAGENRGYNTGYGGGSTYVDTTVRVNEPVNGELKGDNIALSTTAVESLADLVKDGEIVLTIDVGDSTKLTVSFPAKAMTEVAKETGADLTIKSAVANITIPNSVLANEFTSFGNVKVSAHATGSSVGFSIQAGGKALQNIKGLKVEF